MFSKYLHFQCKPSGTKETNNEQTISSQLIRYGTYHIGDQ